MPITRRNILRKFAAGAASAAALRAFGELGFAQARPAENRSVSAGPLVLSRNENPYGPSPKVLAAMREAAARANRYPAGEYDTLTRKLAALHRVHPEQIVLGCGSSELLRMAAETFLGPGKKFVQASPTFPLPGEVARNTGADVISVALNSRHEHDLEMMLARSDASTALVYVCNPNNPTGTITPRAEIQGFIAKLPAKTMVLVDEAYHEFAGQSKAYASFLDRPLDDHRVIVTRTFSKVHGLAGMRIGYAVASPEAARRLSAGHLTLGVGVISARAAAAALDDPDYAALAARRNAADRQEFRNQINARMMRAIDSHTNFVMLDPRRPVEEVFAHLQKNNVQIGPPAPEMSKYLRVSLGTPEEMLQFWKIWDLMPVGKMAM
ncbi:MAG TPA: histidinol-phosphate transaminase [Candidatus Saccharimonadales bacterium]|jgi:histidinol-phosphate aminotransferase|nr:histidinol-phosphate transaminase [Candidatus Saccharimonadales bacterium]